mmetsp:Transcript_11793/g.50831  ORF Transcript_11793/g.50831 Transcript_11793/m.50831 type:complete len:332 (+) Transcript_11793:350-1345(+)
MVQRGGIALRRFGAVGADGQLRAAPSRVPRARSRQQEPRRNQQRRGRGVGHTSPRHRRGRGRQAPVVGSRGTRNVGRELVAVAAGGRRAGKAVAPGRTRRRGVPRDHSQLCDGAGGGVVEPRGPGRDGRGRRGFVQPGGEQPGAIPMGTRGAVRRRPGFRRGPPRLVRPEPRPQGARVPAPALRQRAPRRIEIGSRGCRVLFVAVAAGVRRVQIPRRCSPGFPLRPRVRVAGERADRRGEDDAHHRRVRADGRHRHPGWAIRYFYAPVRVGQLGADSRGAHVGVPEGRQPGAEQAPVHLRRPQRPGGGEDPGAHESRHVHQSRGDPRVFGG